MADLGLKWNHHQLPISILTPNWKVIRTFLSCPSACCADLQVVNWPFGKAFLAKQQVGNKKELPEPSNAK